MFLRMQLPGDPFRTVSAYTDASLSDGEPCNAGTQVLQHFDHPVRHCETRCPTELSLESNCIAFVAPDTFSTRYWQCSV